MCNNPTTTKKQTTNDPRIKFVNIRETTSLVSEVDSFHPLNIQLLCLFQIYHIRHKGTALWFFLYLSMRGIPIKSETLRIIGFLLQSDFSENSFQRFKNLEEFQQSIFHGNKINHTRTPTNNTPPSPPPKKKTENYIWVPV